MTSVMITNKKLRAAMDNEGLSEYGLMRGYNYFFVVSLLYASDEAVHKAARAPRIYRDSFSEMSISDWVETIKDSLNSVK